MIVLLNGATEPPRAGRPVLPSGFSREDVRLALEERFGADGCRARVVAFDDPGPLATLRARLAEDDAETHAIWLAPPGSGLPPGADRGDVGLLVEVAPDDTPRDVADRLWALVRDEVVLAPPDPSWPGLFATRRAELAAAFGPRALSIHHVGSTALGDVPAKPIVDVAVGVAALDEALQVLPALRALGFAFVNYPQNVDRRFFRTVPVRTCQLHVVAEGGPVLAALLRFRDALRASPTLRRRLAALKTDLARRHGGDRVAYGEGKSAFVREVLAAPS